MSFVSSTLLELATTTPMHETLRIPEILLNIFGHCSTPTTSLPESNYNPDLAVLARTCKAFQEPALDMLWEELHDLSPLARCLPEVCRLAQPAEKPRRYSSWGNQPCYLFSRPLKEVEWTTLRSYTRRVRFIRGSPATTFTFLNEETIRVVFSLAPFTDPLFPRLRSLCWREAFAFLPFHVAVPSLTILHLDIRYPLSPPIRGFFDVFGNRCPHVKKLVVDIQSGPVDSHSEISRAISHQICRWPKLQHVHCRGVALNVHAILHLSSIPTLKWLAFTLGDDISHLGSILDFSNVTDLYIASRPLEIIASFLPHIRLPAIETLHVAASAGYTSRRAIQTYWAAVREACPSNGLTCLKLDGFIHEGGGVPLNEEVLPCLSLEDLRPCTAFAELRELHVDFACPVSLTDADLLELVSPRMENFVINRKRGWRINVDGGGITLSGLVQLLRQRPSLIHLCLAIDTRTFTEIPDGMDVSFPPRNWLEINFVDSYILPEFVPKLVSVFAVLALDPSLLRVWDWMFLGPEEFGLLWERVLDALGNASQQQSVPSIV